MSRPADTGNNGKGNAALPQLDEHMLEELSPEVAVEVRVGALLAQYQEQNRLSSSDEMQINAMRSQMQSSLLRHIGLGALLGFLAGTPFPPRLRTPARIVGFSLGSMLGVHFSYKSGKDEVLRTLVELESPLGRDVRSIFSRYCPNHSAFAGVRMPRFGESSTDEEFAQDFGEEMEPSQQTIGMEADVSGESSSPPFEFGDDRLSPSWEAKDYENFQDSGKPIRRNQWGDELGDDDV